MLVAVDICNTIANVNLELLRYFRLDLEKYPHPAVPPEFFESGRGQEVFFKADPFPGAQETLFELHKRGCRIEYVTSRPQSAKFVTKRWLTIHGFPSGRIIFAGGPKEKADLVHRRRYVLFFEDDPRVINELLALRCGVDILVKDWQYNRSLKQEQLVRFRRWRELGTFSRVRLGE